jgi:polysaccharide biosynthesis/export protein
MTQQSQGIFRPLIQMSGGVVLCILLTGSSAFSQKQKPPSPDLPKSESVIEANERLTQLALASTAKQGDYVIGTGDLIGIEVFDIPELTRDVRVNETGYISLPLLPAKIQVAGLTSFQLQDKIAELLQANGLVSSPQVTVSLKEQRSQPVTVIGAVKAPTVIQAVRQTTLVQALSQAGGISDDAGNLVLVTRPASPTTDPFSSNPGGAAGTTTDQPQTFTINLSDLLESGDARFNIQVMGGDVISVPKAGIIYVVGAVVKPGGFLIQNDRDRMTALKMLSLAGGTTSTAKASQAVILRKNLDTGKRDEVPLDLHKVLKLKSQDVTLQASDILFVPDSAGKHAMQRAGDVAVSLTAGAALIGVSRF